MYRCSHCGLVSPEAQVSHALFTTLVRSCPACAGPVVPVVPPTVIEPVSTIDQRAKETQP